MESAARSYCSERLAASGYSVTEETFAFSSRGARLTPPAAGVFAALVAFLAARLAIAHDSYLLALIVVMVACILGVLEFRLVLGPGRRSTDGREHGTNLIAVRGVPRVWLVAHVDSKSQTIPMLLRIAGVIGLVSGMVGLLLTLVLGIVSGALGNVELARWLDLPVVLLATVVVVSSVPLAFCWIGNRSPGALDNASGVAAVLLAADATSRDAIGVAITSAEEVGLAGSRAFVAGRTGGIAVNCDTIDDAGEFVAMRSGGSRSNATIDALIAASLALRIEVSQRRTLPGVVTDATALSQAGWDVVTLSRGNLATLARVHTSRDTPERIDGTGIALAARLLTATIEELS
jgi:hypothetical protein